MSNSKILVVGAIQGRLKKAFEKISKLHAKQDFSLTLVVGDLFGSNDHAADELDALLTGSITVSVTTYFTLGDSPLPEQVIKRLEYSDEVCPNLHYLGRKSTFTTSDGIRIVSLGGRLVQNESSMTTKLGKFDPLYLENDVRGLHGAHSAHILLTNQWPANIHRLSGFELPEKLEKDISVQSVADLCLALKPWYHFASSPNASWEREPFKQPDEYGSLDAAKITRFKSLAGVDTNNKEWMSAFVIKVGEPPAAQQSTEVPFLRSSQPRKRVANDEHPESYSRYGRGDHVGRGRKRDPKWYSKTQSDCFMCLNRPDFKAHMVASIGDESHVSILRGPLPLPHTFPELSFSGHVMIIPHYHAADELAHGKRSTEEVRIEFEELTKYRKALSSTIGAKSEGKLGTVCWTVNRTGIRHFHWQLIAIRADQVQKGLVEAAFKVSCQNKSLPSFQTCEPDEQLEQHSDYFRLWLWAPTTDPVQRANGEASGEVDKGTTKSIYFPLAPDENNFHIWFGREVMAGIMQLENRVNWMSALHPDEAEETKMEEADADGLKIDFQDFDFAMQ